ncbi:hypothetical protein A1O1_03678 [Capronia coronata CBS 617.96]|uniref:Protein HRI1 n=1 Tax=Capronia coronata CBS 617.96 TaxID=1182541 RepID=W9YLM2_9EURO|nr:uncharacterized protein A1O1_03678 [Capronia coronata CBS 617.96]EXJ90575.1 hypothetical protein A1O1_03678 [Capronia coronata CBS 617.96]
MEFYGMTGEKLGTIGQVGTMTELPRWKKAFLEKPSISIRKGIAWGYSPPYEDTSTLVLTSPNAVFIDVRFPLQPTDPSKPVTSDPAFWAFSGTSSTTFHPESSAEVSMPYSAHSAWKHEIDSKGPGISDEGDMFLLPNDDCIEVGMMESPQTKRVEMYKEYWTAPAAELGSGSVIPRTPCVVAQTVESKGGHGGAKGTGNGKGVVIRIGDYCQGIVEQCGEDGSFRGVLVERWQKVPVERNPLLSSDTLGARDSTANHTDWVKDQRSNTPEGETLMPCLWICEHNRRLGDEVVIHGIAWRVVEMVL